MQSSSREILCSTSHAVSTVAHLAPRLSPLQRSALARGQRGGSILRFDVNWSDERCFAGACLGVREQQLLLLSSATGFVFAVQCIRQHHLELKLRVQLGQREAKPGFWYL
jgi:hypothetical protein